MIKKILMSPLKAQLKRLKTLKMETLLVMRALRIILKIVKIAMKIFSLQKKLKLWKM